MRSEIENRQGTAIEKGERQTSAPEMAGKTGYIRR